MLWLWFPKTRGASLLYKTFSSLAERHCFFCSLVILFLLLLLLSFTLEIQIFILFIVLVLIYIYY
jgi:hypothetical protein